MDPGSADDPAPMSPDMKLRSGREKAVKGKKEGTGAFLFDIAMSNQWYFDQLLEIGVAPADRRKPLKLMRYTVRFELRYVTHKGVRCQLHRIKSRDGTSPSMVQVLNCAFEAGLDPEAVLHAEEATLPGKGTCPVYSGKINLFLN